MAVFSSSSVPTVAVQLSYGLEEDATGRSGKELGSWETIANRLLEEGLVLTALELHTELLEGKRELPLLRDYFSNPGNFEHAIPQPLAALRTSNMGREYDSVPGNMIVCNLHIILLLLLLSLLLSLLSMQLVLQVCQRLTH